MLCFKFADTGIWTKCCELLELSPGVQESSLSCRWSSMTAQSAVLSWDPFTRTQKKKWSPADVPSVKPMVHLRWSNFQITYPDYNLPDLPLPSSHAMQRFLSLVPVPSGKCYQLRVPGYIVSCSIAYSIAYCILNTLGLPCKTLQRVSNNYWELAHSKAQDSIQDSMVKISKLTKGAWLMRCQMPSQVFNIEEHHIKSYCAGKV